MNEGWISTTSSQTQTQSNSPRQSLCVTKTPDLHREPSALPSGHGAVSRIVAGFGGNGYGDAAVPAEDKLLLLPDADRSQHADAALAHQGSAFQSATGAKYLSARKRAVRSFQREAIFLSQRDKERL